MDNKEIFSQVSSIEERIGGLHDELRGLKEQLALLIEENHYLKLENENLRKRLDETVEEEAIEQRNSTKKKSVGEGYDNLARLYQEGFHICSTDYGSIRKDDCLFCLSFFNQK
ncbi:DNA replication initiation control protein YabA [Alkalihalophilus pseudofirmus]|uniref:DNA replication initiation control protein YabA n=1 Tax=Alkalihalobacterium alkalinitrilicum TaxID=427920 RepID=UPI00094C1220|nr:DNA replication initiation control protein YabA [Alkalihalobacterium alkalinitrilicum]OLO27451.1 DNA replication initiation control protein YabA [Alkalihalophilus pseudofirmus]